MEVDQPMQGDPADQQPATGTPQRSAGPPSSAAVAVSPGPLPPIPELPSADPTKPNSGSLTPVPPPPASLSISPATAASPPASAKPMDAEANAAATALANVAANAASASAAASSGTPAPVATAPAPSAPAVPKSGPGSANFDPAAPHAVDGLPNPLPANYDKTQPICANCATQTTPLWRRSHDSTHILCNACALFFKMKGRPRPISLKTDVIKSRNRSKGKSTSKDRSGAAAKAAAAGGAANAGASPAGGSSKDRSESMTRSGEGRKSAPGGAGEEDDHDMADGRTKAWGEAALDAEGRKARKMMPAGPPAPYGMVGYPGYPYPYPYPHGAHPHAHQPYPPPRSRSRSSDPTRRAHSVDARRGPSGGPSSADGTPTHPGPGVPPPFPYPGFHPGAPAPSEGYPPPYPFYPYGPPPTGYPPGQPPHYPYPAPHFPHAAALAHAAQQALVPPSITHAQSDSRSRSPKPDEGSRPGSVRDSASPPHTAAPTPSHAPIPVAVPPPQSWYPHPNPNYHLHQPHTHSPLSGPRPQSVSRATSGSPANGVKLAPVDEQSKTTDANGRVTLAPIVSATGAVAGGSGSPRAASGVEPAKVANDDKVHLPSLNSAVAASTTFSGPNVARHTGLFEARPPATTSAGEVPAQAGLARSRGASVSSASPSVSGSSEGVRSPEASSRTLAPWGGASATVVDERRGRPEKRFEDYGASVAKGKGREDDIVDELEEVDELDEEGPETQRRMVGVETGLNELRVSSSTTTGAAGAPPPHLQPSSRSTASPSNGMRRGGASSRSRSGVRGEERGRSRGVLGAGGSSTHHRSGSTSTSRARGSSSASSGRGRGEGIAANGVVAAIGKEHWPPEALAEIARLKTKISELTFLNGLMQSRLGQLEGPGRVPRNVMTSLTAESPRPDPDYLEEEDEDEQMDRPEGIEEEMPAGF
ncbi:hypothetical protein JCM1841_003266 [Sporobolomyces salmonicolor]